MGNLAFKKGEDNYTSFAAIMDKTWIHPDKVQAVLQQGVGHCCAASMLCKLSSSGFWNDKAKVQMFIDELKDKWKTESLLYGEKDPNNKWASPERITLFTCSGFYVLLSPENYPHTKALVAHPDLKKVHSFKNRRLGINPFANDIDLYFMEFDV